MDLLYNWITSLLRPRAATFSKPPTSCDNPHCLNTKKPTSQPDTVVYSAAVTKVEHPLEPPHRANEEDPSANVNNIELVPTLEFVAHQDTYEQLQQCLRTCCSAHIEDSPPPQQQQAQQQEQLEQQEQQEQQKQQQQQEQQPDNESTSSVLTYTIERANSESEKEDLQQFPSQQQESVNIKTSSLSLLTANLSRQADETPVSLTDTEAFGSLSSTCFDDPPTSSISIDMMDSSASKTTTGGTTTGSKTSTTDHLPATSTNTRSGDTRHSYVPQSLTQPSSLSDEIEEEIEEAIELSEELEGGGESSSDAIPGPSGKQPPTKTEQLFGIDISDISSSDNSLPLPESVRIEENSSQDDEQFKIDDEQLSGGKLAQHFVLNDEDDDTAELSISLPIEGPPKHSSHETDESIEGNVGQQQSLTNQSTSDDVSELHEESVEELEDIIGDSLPLEQEVGKEMGMSLQDSSVEFLLGVTKLSTLKNVEKGKEDKSLRTEDFTDLDVKDKSLEMKENIDKVRVAPQQLSPKQLISLDMKDSRSEKNSLDPLVTPESLLHQRQKSESPLLKSIENLQIPEMKTEMPKVFTQPDESIASSSIKDNMSSIEGDSLLHFLESSKGISAKMSPSPVTKVENLIGLDEKQESLKKIENLQISKSPQTDKIKLEPLPMPKGGQMSGTKLDPIQIFLQSEVNHSSSTAPATVPLKSQGMKHSLPELFENPDIKPLSGASSLHSDKDQSIDEIMASNHSLEMTLETQDISSLNPSFLQNNESLINDLLTDSPRKSPVFFELLPQQKETKENQHFILENSAEESSVSFKQEEEQKLSSYLPNIQYAAEYVEKTDFQQMESCGELLEKTLHSDMVTDLDDSLSPTKAQDRTLQPLRIDTIEENEEGDEEEEDTSLQLMKLRILAMKQLPKESQLSPSGEVTHAIDSSQVKPMERVALTEFTKDVLEDITEESERNSLSTQEEQQHSINVEKTFISNLTSKLESTRLQQSEMENSQSSNSIVSLNMVQMLEQKVGELQQMLASKDACLASLNMQLENSQRRESSEQMGSGRDSSSIVTNSTEYRTLQEEFGQPTMDIYMELTKRDELIAKLTDSLQQSLTVRENLRTESDKLATEVQLLRKQLTDAMDTLKRPCWPKTDQESNFGQRISEISMDLVSESDDDFERQYFTDTEEKFSRNSRERQLSMPRQFEYPPCEGDLVSETTPFSKQIEQFQKYLTPSEDRLFFMVQKKFDDYLCQELEKCKMKNEQEIKIVMDQWDTEKREKEAEIQRLLAHKTERESKHNQEMEDLRKYFETKCADLEKQFSDDVFSQQSQRQGMSSTDVSDQEQLPDDFMASSLTSRSKESSPRKRSRAALLLSPSHRQMTPGNEVFNEEPQVHEGSQLALEITELKRFYQNKIHEIQRSQENNMKKLSDRLKYYESRYPEDEFMLPTKNSMLNSTCESSVATEDATQSTVYSLKHPVEGYAIATASYSPDFSEAGAMALLPSSPAPLIGQTNNNNNSSINNSLIIIDTDELNANNETQIIQKIIDEYERRLQEQLELAREDIVQELEQQIQTLLSETTADDQHWPKELILLREKFTAKSQLEIAQLQIKHAEEMSRLKLDYEKQLNRKNNRHMTFDAVREFDKLRGERDNLRALSKAFRQVLAELLKCVATCENDITETLMQEVQRLLSCNRTLEEHALDDYSFNATLINETLNNSKMRLIPDVHSLLEVIEDPSLIEFIAQRNSDMDDDFDLKDCLEKLRSEASYLLHLSEDLAQKQIENDMGRKDSFSSEAEKNDSCCEQEDGLKLQQARKFIRVNSLNEQQLPTHKSMFIAEAQNLSSLPPDLNRLYPENNPTPTMGVNATELHFQLTELKNRLVKSETDRLKLQQELDHTISRNSDLGLELQNLRDQLSQLSSLNNVEYNEGYGMACSMKSPQRLSFADPSAAGFVQLQEKARNILSTPTQKQQSNDSTVQLLQMIEDFCREGDKVVECSKKDKEDLQSQIDTADKQLKATRQFLEEQAIEREQERDEFLKEIENLKAQLRDKEKERSSYANASEEVEHLESQIRELTQKLQDINAKRDKFEVELKASIDKIFVLREIISDLETQVETKALNEHVMGEKVKQLEDYINSQSRSNEALQMEVHSLKGDIEHGYQVRIHQLEEKLQNIRPPAEQSIIMDQVVEQLKDIESALEQKTKNLEALHQSTSSSVASLSCPEDVSARGAGPNCVPDSAATQAEGSPIHPSPRQHSMTMEGVQRVVEKLSKHTRIEEAAVKRIRDLEMQVTQMRTACVELQYERESLQERMSEQTQRISALQSRLEEQRQRAEELQRGNTSDLNIRIHDLQNDLQNTRELLSNRDKQLATMKQQLEKSKMAIDRLEAELAVEQQPDRSIVEKLEVELKQKSAENQKLKDKIKNEMINKLALPDLMETMLADKNEEIDHLKEQLESKEKELKSFNDQTTNERSGEMFTKLGTRTFSEIASISELEEPDIVRRAAVCQTSSPLLQPQVSDGGYLQNTMDTSKGAVANLTHKRSDDLAAFVTLQHANTFDHPHYFQDPNALGSVQSGTSSGPSPLVPRQINFSNLTEDSKLKTPSFQHTLENRAHGTHENRATIESLENEVKELRRQFDNLQQEDADRIRQLQQDIADKSLEIDRLLREQEKWQKEKTELLSKHEKNVKNLQESEAICKQRMHELEEKLLKSTENEVNERDSLRKELRAISEMHEQCKYTAKDNESRKKAIENLNQEIKQKDERLLTLSTKLSMAEDNISELQKQIVNLEKEVEKWKQHSSENSSRQFSVDEVAQQIEKELNYSAQLDSNILKAIESEEENNLDRSHANKNVMTEPLGTTDDENFTGERDLLNQLEIVKAQITVERDHAEELRQELAQEKQHSHEVQEQDVVIIEAMRKRLEAAMDQEDELHKQLDMERVRCERLQTQLTTLQRTESRRNSSLLKSPTESPRKSPRSLTDFESELAERLRSEIKLLTAQNERERERSADLQKNSERERSRYEKELSDRIDYCEKLKKEMEKVARDKDSSEMEVEHLQERLMLQTQEIESLEARIASLQEAETRRCTRKEKHQKENAQLMAELQELKSKLLTMETEKDNVHKTIIQLRFDIERSAQREGKLAESLANANEQLAEREGTASVPEQFLEKMKVLNTVLALNTQENKQMAETVQYLVEERGRLNQKCEELESQVGNTAKLSELEERCNHLLGRYLRVESHRKALVYQKRYLKTSLQCYQNSEQRALAALNGGHMLQQQKPKKKLFKTVALAIIAIQRLKYIGRIWHTGKRIVSKSVFTITQQKRAQVPNVNCSAESPTSPLPSTQTYHRNGQDNSARILERPLAPLKTPTLLNGGARTPSSAASTASGTAFEWPAKSSNNKNLKMSKGK